jgi:MoxR-like ATPase
LQAAVNVALALGQPLLLTGEPGSGKTQLAFHVATRFANLYGPHVFNAQTGSTKRDLFYHYDALGHFHFAQATREQGGDLDPQIIEDRFIRYEALGKAIREAEMDGKRSVVLIDEIDKAPRDLPNDLLAALEDLRFEVPEIPGEPKRVWTCPKNKPPFIVITSNSEKNLPEAFLRRVVYHHIEFPDGKKLLEILKAKNIVFPPDADLDAIVAHFEAIRGKGLNKKPATAELIAWATLLPRIGFPTHKLKDATQMTDKELELLKTSYAALAKTREDLQKLA